MQPGPLRRYARRAEPRPVEVVRLTHTSPSVAAGQGVRLSEQYLAILRRDLRRAQEEQALWTGEVLLEAEAERANRDEIRRQAREEASRVAEIQRQEQQRIRDERLAEQRARAAEWEERQRQERERIRREQEEAERRQREERAEEERRRREEQAAAEAARRRAAEAERRRRERLRTCAVCMEDNDLDAMVETPCRHWYCRTCLRGMKHTKNWNWTELTRLDSSQMVLKPRSPRDPYFNAASRTCPSLS